MLNQTTSPHTSFAQNTTVVLPVPSLPNTNMAPRRTSASLWPSWSLLLLLATLSLSLLQSPRLAAAQAAGPAGGAAPGAAGSKPSTTKAPAIPVHLKPVGASQQQPQPGPTATTGTATSGTGGMGNGPGTSTSTGTSRGTSGGTGNAGGAGSMAGPAVAPKPTDDDDRRKLQALTSSLRQLRQAGAAVTGPIGTSTARRTSDTAVNGAAGTTTATTTGRSVTGGTGVTGSGITGGTGTGTSGGLGGAATSLPSATGDNSGALGEGGAGVPTGTSGRRMQQAGAAVVGAATTITRKNARVNARSASMVG